MASVVNGGFDCIADIAHQQKKAPRFPGRLSIGSASKSAFRRLVGRGRGRGGRRALLCRGGGFLAAGVERVVLALHRALEMGAGFDGDGLVDDVAFDAGGRGQAHLQAADAADDVTVDHDVVGDQFAAAAGSAVHALGPR